MQQTCAARHMQAGRQAALVVLGHPCDLANGNGPALVTQGEAAQGGDVLHT